MSVDTMDLDVLKDNVSFLKEQLSSLKEKQAKLEKQSKALEIQHRVFPTITQRQEADTRSIYVRGFPPQTTARELAEFFMKRIGTVVRSTVLMNRQDGRSLGYAYLEFDGTELAQRAIYMDLELRTMCVGKFNDRDINVELIVKAKRTNLPGFRRMIAPRAKNNSSINSKNVARQHSKLDPNFAHEIRGSGEEVKSFFTNDKLTNENIVGMQENANESMGLWKINKETEENNSTGNRYKGKLVFTTRTHEEVRGTTDDS